MVLSKSALVAPILTATAKPCSISSEPRPCMCSPTTCSRNTGLKMRCSRKCVSVGGAYTRNWNSFIHFDVWTVSNLLRRRTHTKGKHPLYAGLIYKTGHRCRLDDRSRLPSPPCRHTPASWCTDSSWWWWSDTSGWKKSCRSSRSPFPRIYGPPLWQTGYEIVGKLPKYLVCQKSICYVPISSINKKCSTLKVPGCPITSSALF